MSGSLAQRIEDAQPAETDTPRFTLLDDLEQNLMPKLTPALPEHLEPARFVRIVLNTVQRTPDLLKCTPTSVKAAIMLSGQLGLEPDVRGLSYLIPRWNSKQRALECTFLIGYRGYIDLYRRSGLGVSVQAHVVREGDTFVYEYGTESKLRHRPLLEATDGRAVRGAYAVVQYHGGGHDFIVFPTAEIDARRQRSSTPDKGPWVSDWDAMARKTMVRALGPYLPQTPVLAIALRVDDRVHVDADLPDNILDMVDDDVDDDSPPAGPRPGRAANSAPPAAAGDGADPPEQAKAGGGDDAVRGSAASDPPPAEEPPALGPDDCRICFDSEYGDGPKARIETSDGPMHAECAP